MTIVILRLDIGELRFDGEEGNQFDIFVFSIFRVWIRTGRAECVERIVVYARRDEINKLRTRKMGRPTQLIWIQLLDKFGRWW